MKRYVKCLTVAGSDSGGGAGIQADIKTMSALGVFGMSAITAVTAQNTTGVTDIFAIPVETVRRQITAVMDDMGADAVKIGMVYIPETAMMIAEMLDIYRPANSVLDPVLLSSTRHRLFSSGCEKVIKQELMKRVTLITPNIYEAARLSGVEITGRDDMRKAACVLLDRGANAVLVKGGDSDDREMSYDFLADRDGMETWLESERIHSRNTHGTGCSLSSAIASYLAMGRDLKSAVAGAKLYITEAIRNGNDVVNGKGSGGINHFFAPVKLIKRQ